MLSRLAGETHQVFSGVWLVHEARAAGFVETSHVRFRNLTALEIREYMKRKPEVGVLGEELMERFRKYLKGEGTL